MTTTRHLRRLAAVLLPAALLTTPVAAAEIEADADRILREMSDHLAALKSFAVETEVSAEILTGSGEKLQAVGTGAGVFDRERGFHFRRAGIGGDMELVYDGTTITLYSAIENGYHSTPFTGDNDAVLDEVRSAFGVEGAAGADLLYSDPYEGLNFEVESGRYLGEAVVGGVRAHHLAYRASEIDWQIWIQADGDPLPLRYVITSKWTTSAPQFTVQIRRWDTSPDIADDAFVFVAPEGATELAPASFDEADILISE